MTNDILKLSVAELSAALERRELSSSAVTLAYLDSIEAQEERLGAYITVCSEEAMAAARSIDARRAAGEQLPTLAGIPMALKDNICTRGVRTTCASRMLEHFVPSYNATCVERLRENGAVLLGKLNMDELAMGSTTETSYFKLTRNPRCLDCVPGGSSGGSAAAVAAGEAPYTLGSDTGGSVRQPASFCGVVGMKPTYGSVSRYGLVAFASSLDQIGPITRCVRDNALVLKAIVGHDRRDAMTAARDYGDLTRAIGCEVRGMRIGMPQEFFDEGLDAEVRDAVLGAARTLEGLGAELIPLSLPTLTYALPAYYVISSAEASSNLARFDGVRYGYRAECYSDVADLYVRSRSEGFGEEVKRRIMLGVFALSEGYYDEYYQRAQRVRTLVTRELERALELCDLLLSPTAPTTAYRIGERLASPLERYMGDIYTVPVNIAGLPALSLPCGVDSRGLPIGVQLIGAPFGEAELYRAGAALEHECNANSTVRCAK